MSYLYGNNVLKAHLGRITENTPKYPYKPTHLPMIAAQIPGRGRLLNGRHSPRYTSPTTTKYPPPTGFGVTAYSTAECRKVEPTAIVGIHSITGLSDHLWLWLQCSTRQISASTCATKTHLHKPSSTAHTPACWVVKLTRRAGPSSSAWARPPGHGPGRLCTHP